MNRRLLPGATLCLLFLSGCSTAQPSAQGARSDQSSLPKKAPGRYRFELAAGGQPRSFSLRVPPQYDGSRPIPLVVLLHGWTVSGAGIESMSGFPDVADREGFALLTPEGLGNPQGWNAGFLDLSGKRPDDIAFLSAALDRAERELGIDPNRIYVAGHSNGAMLAHFVGAKLSSRVAAIGAVAGTIGLPFASGGPKTIPEPAGPVSVMIIHSKLDETVTFEPSLPGLLKGVGAEESARWWAKRLGTLSVPSHDVVINGRVLMDTWRGGRNSTEVSLITLLQGSHAWPRDSAGVNATEVLWKFFREHPRRSTP